MFTFGCWGCGIEVFGRGFIFFGGTRENLPGNGKDTFDPWPVDLFGLTGFGDVYKFGRFGGYLAFGGED